MEFDPLPPAKRPRPQPAGSGRRPRSRRRRALLVGAPLAIALLLGGLLGVGFAAVIHMPQVESLADFTPSLTTQLFDASGEIFATFARERRHMLSEDEVPERLQQAVLAAEDANFFQHGGIDARGVLRAALKNLTSGRRAEGASTITMQLARQLFLSPEKAWRRKIEEAFLAVELEKNFSKPQILALYSNLIFMGHGNYGMAAAAADYFGKPVADLTVAEAATLAGIPQRPSAYSPRRAPELVVQRRNYVLRRMLEEGFITNEAHEEALAAPLEVIETTFNDEIAPYFAEEIRQYLESSYGTAGLLEKGLQVVTTLDPDIQRAAGESLREGLVRLDQTKAWRGPLERLEAEDLETIELPGWTRLDLSPGAWNRGVVLEADRRRARIKLGDEIHDLLPAGIKWTGRTRPSDLLKRGEVAWFRFEAAKEEGDAATLHLTREPELEGAVLVLETATGAVRAMVGGWDFARSKFNRATQAKRQVGSAFKPLVFGAALEMGYTPADTLFDSPVAFLAPPPLPIYSPRNYYREYYGIVTLRRALEFSWNVTAVKLQDLITPAQVVDFARRTGITSALPPYPSLALGAADLSPMELATAYAAVANHGLHVEPYMIESVATPANRVLESHRPRVHKAMEPEIAFVLGRMLEGVIDRGTGKDVSDLDLDLAGKTGTTDSYSDAWFAGYTPRYTILVWVGHDVKRPIGRNMTGTRAALPVWRRIVERGLEQGWLAAGERFLPPTGVVFQPVEYLTGFLPGPGAGQVIEETFVAGTEPARQYDVRWARIMELPWYQQRPYYIPKSGEKMPEDIDDWTPVLEAWAEKAKQRDQR